MSRPTAAGSKPDHANQSAGTPESLGSLGTLGEGEDAESLFRRLFENVAVPMIAFAVEDDGGFSVGPFNREFTAARGGRVTPDQIGHRIDESGLPEEQLAHLRSLLQQAVDQRSPIRLDDTFPFLGQDTTWLVSLAPVEDDSGRVVLVVVTLTDITERVLVEKELKHTSAQLLQVFRSDPDALVITDPDCRIIRVNPSFEALFGYEEGEVLGKRTAYLESAEPQLHPLSSTEASGPKTRCYATKAYRTFWGETREHVIRDGLGQEIGHQLLIRDVTERLKEQQAQARLAAIVETSRDAIFTKDADEVITSWNAGAQEVYGYSADEIVGRRVSILAPPDLSDEPLTLTRRVQEDGETVPHYETKRLRKDGTLIDVSLSLSPIRDSAGGIDGISVISRDITDQKRAGEARSLLAAIVASSHDAIFTKDFDEIITSWNAGATEILGYAAEDIMGHSVEEMMPPERKGEPHELTERVRRGERVVDFESERLHKDGSRVLLSLTLSPLHDENGEIVAVSVTGRDITHRKRAEAAIAESEQLFRALVENSPDIVARYDLEHRSTYVNPSFERLAGSSAEQLIGKRARDDSQPPASKLDLPIPKRYDDYIGYVIESGKEFSAQMPLRSADEGMRWYEMRFVPEPGPDGTVTTVLAIGRDIHDIKESERRFRTLADAFPDFLVRFDRDCRFTYINPVAEHMLGRHAEDLLGKSIEQLEPGSPLRQNLSVLAAVRRTFEEGVESKYEARWDTAQGRRIFEGHHVPELDASGTVVGVIAVAHDITERTLAEETIRESQHMLSQAEVIAHVGYWDRDLRAGTVTLSAEAARIFGLGLEKHEFSSAEWNERWLAMLHPDDRRPTENAAADSIEGGMAHDVEYRIVLPDGDVRYIHSVAEAAEGDGEDPLHVFGTMQDVTDIKRAEHELRRLNRELRAISNCNQTLLHAVDEQSLLDEICSVICDEAGYLLAWVGYAEDDEHKSIRPVASAGHGSSYVAETDLSWSEAEERGKGPAGRAIRTGKPAQVDFATDEQLSAWRERSAEYGFRTCVALPLRDRNAIVFGVLLIYSEEPNVAAPEEIALLEELADNLAFGISTIRARAELASAEAALRENEARYRELFENTSDMIVIAQVTEDDRFQMLDFNPAWERVIGSRAMAMLGGYLDRDSMQEHGSSEFFPQYQAAVRSGKTVEFEHDLKTSTGILRAATTLIPISDASGSVYRLVSVSRDITEQYRIEEERYAHLKFFDNTDQIDRILRSAGDLEQTLDEVIDVVLTVFGCDRAWLAQPCDPDGETWRIAAGRTRPQFPSVLDTTADQSMSPAATGVFKALLASAEPVQFGPEAAQDVPTKMREQLGVQSFMAMALHPRTGGPWTLGIHQCSYPRVWTAEEERLLLEIGRRLTDALTNMLARRNLQESEARLQLILANSPDIIAYQDRDLRYTWASNLTPLPRAGDIVGKTDEELLPAQEAAFLTTLKREVLTSGTSRHEEVPSHIAGGLRWHDTFIQPIRDDAGQVVGVGYYARDITKRKQVEEALRDSEEKYRAIFDDSPLGIFRTSREGRFLEVNPALAKMLGYDSPEDLAHEVTDIARQVYANPEDRAELLTREASCGTPMQQDVPLRRRDGSEFVASVSVRVTCDSDGEPIYQEGIIEDVTERQAAEDALRESEATYRSLVAAMPAGVVLQGADGTVIAANPAAERILGRTQDEIVGASLTGSLWGDAVREDGRPFPQEEQPAPLTLRTGTPQHNVAMGIRRPDGSLRWISINTEPVIPAQDQSLHGAVAVFHDVTEQKRAELELRRAALYARDLIEASLDPLVTIGLDGKITDVNRATERATGLAREQLIGTEFAQYFTEPDRAAAGLRRALDSGTVRDYPLTIKSVSGETTSVMYNATTYGDETGAADGVLAAARDMRELERAESETRNVLLDMIETISLTVEKRDPYTSGHQRRVAELASAIAGQMGLEPSVVEGVRMGGLIHDIGKIHVPVDILAKPGQLTDSEWRIIQSHPAVGAEIVHGLRSPWPIEAMILQHHERLDGSGYPSGLSADEIVLEARILAVADVVEATASDRPYRPAGGLDRALTAIIAGDGTMFDSQVVRACTELFRNGEFEFSTRVGTEPDQ